jgi:hypothetical protein
VPARALLDDFEDAAGRSRAGTLWLNNTDGGHDHSEMIYHRTLRAPGNHALTVLAKMSEKDRPAASMVLPLAPGAVEPVDARGFRGVEFEARGSGAYHLRAITRAARDRNAFAAEFNAAPAWRKTRIPFANLKQRPGGKAVWSGADLLALEFDFDRKAGEKAWLEIDNLRFYK